MAMDRRKRVRVRIVVGLYRLAARALGLLGVHAHGCDGRRDVASIQGLE